MESQNHFNLRKNGFNFLPFDRNYCGCRVYLDYAGAGIQGEVALFYLLLGGFFTFLHYKFERDLSRNKLNADFRYFSSLERVDCIDSGIHLYLLQSSDFRLSFSTSNYRLAYVRFLRIGIFVPSTSDRPSFLHK